MAMPFGMYYLEKPERSEYSTELPIYYDESADCSMITHNQHSIPFVKSALSCVSTVIVTRQDSDPPEDDEDGDDRWHSANSWLTTLTATKTTGEGPEDDDDAEYSFANPWLMTVTVTEVAGEGPQDDDGDDRDSMGGW